MVNVLIVDNYDSFTYNLYHLVEKSGTCSISVIRNNRLDMEKMKPYDKIIFSPGPGLPKESPAMFEIIKCLGSTKSILGVCLGHQAIGEYFGSRLKNLDVVCHGKAMNTTIMESEGIFKNIKNPFLSARYHSWVVDPVGFPECLQITAKDDDGRVMGLRHKTMDINGIQFHPESILSEFGEVLMKNWLNN